MMQAICLEARRSSWVAMLGILFSMLWMSAAPAQPQPVTSAGSPIASGSAPAHGSPAPQSGLRSVDVAPANFTESPASSGDDVVTLEKVNAEIVAVEALTDLDPEIKKDLLSKLAKSVERLQGEQDAIRRMKELETQLAAVPELKRLATQELAIPSAIAPVEFPAGATIASLESKLTELRHLVETDEAALKAKEAEIEGRATRLSEVGKEIIEAEKKLAEAKQLLSTLSGTELSTKIQQIEQKSRIRLRQQQLLTSKLEQQRLEAITELLPMQRDLAKRSASNNKKLLLNWQTAVDTWRKEESQRQAADARRVAQNSHPALKSLATKNAEIAELRIKTAADIESLTKSIKRLGENALHFESVFKDLKQKVEHVGPTSSTGVLLLNQRAELPSDREFQKRAEFVQEALPEARLKLLELNDLRREMSDPSEMASQLLDSFNESLADFDQAQVLEVLTRLLSDRRDFLDKASADQNTYLEDLNELELANQALSEQVQEFREYLDQRVMWIRSAEPFGIRDLRDAVQGASAILSPSRWLEVLTIGGIAFLRRPAGGIAVLSLFLLLLLGRVRLLAMQTRFSEPPTETEEARFPRYVLAMLVAMVLSARWPVLLLAAGYRLKHSSGATEWTQAVGQACLSSVVFLWGWELVREVCRRGGIGERIFHWSTTATSSVRNTLELTLMVGTPLLAMLHLSQFAELAEFHGLERTLFIATLSLCSLQLGLLTRPSGRLMKSFEQSSTGSVLHSMRAPIWICSTFSPLLLAILSISGYHFSAYQLSARLAESGAAVITVVLLYSLALSWLDVKSHNQKLAIATETQEPSPPAVIMSEIDEYVDEIEETPAEAELPRLQKEFRDLMGYAAMVTLLGAGWVIWSSVFPAVRILDNVELWQNTETVAESIVNEDGQEQLRMNEHQVPTTLTDVLIACLVFSATVSLGRRLPGLLELTVLERLPIDQGGRQAIGILIKYAATLAGVLISCQIIRLSWSSVQWLAAAMTVGLGFGLQEIFANLVSGLIILFERPIRAGDIVTVDGITGSITRMQMRATTITDFDRRELIVPNKKFITDNVINWTLSDPISRVVLPVGVAYGSDVKLVQSILLRIARRSSFVMQSPAPSTLFKGFGDSTLNLELRVFIPKRDLYLDVVNELNLAIVKEFERYKIEIAFPQRDLHIRTIDGLPMAMRPPAAEPQDREAA